MTTSRAKAIIAVFGSNDDKAVAFAKRLGAAIAKREHILLTGGKGPGPRPVKASAIAGVGSSPWIGVERPGRKEVSPRSRFITYENGSGFLPSSDLNKEAELSGRLRFAMRQSASQVKLAHILRWFLHYHCIAQ